MPRFARSYRVLADSPPDMISFEECLVRYWRGNDAILLFYVNPPSVIIGRNQNYWREVAPSCTIPVFRRASGGGAVYHDLGNLNWSMIVPRELHSKEEELCLMAKAISTGRRVEIRDFGGFSLSYVKPRTGRNPKTGESVQVPAKYVPRFKMGKELRERVDQNYKKP